MRRVPEVIDAWFDSGAMPFAQWHAPFENEELVRAALPGRLHLRGARPDARLVLLAARGLDAAVRPLLVQERALPRPDPRPRGPEDVQVAGATWSSLGRARRARRGRVPLVLLHLASSRGTATASRSRPSARACASSCSTLWNTYGVLRPLRERERLRPRATPAAEPTELDRWILSRLQRTIATSRASASTTTTRPAPAARSRRSSTTSRTGTCAARGGASGTATRRRFATLRARACVTVAKLLAPLTPFVADEIYENLDGARAVGAPVRLPGAGASRDERARVGDGRSRATPSSSGRAARAQAKIKVRQPLREAVVVAADREREAIERSRSWCSTS